jgi:multiple sugar transport system substrate-binding protein
MKLQRRHLLLATAATVAGAPAARADATCPALAAMQGEINLVGNSLPVVQHLAAQAQACSHPGLKVAFKVTPQARQETERAFAAPARAPFDGAVVSSAVFSGLYSRRQLLPLTNLVQRLGQGLEERMLVRMDGEVMAIAFMQNTQSFVYRQDLFARHDLAVPTTHAQMLRARWPWVLPRALMWPWSSPTPLPAWAAASLNRARPSRHSKAHWACKPCKPCRL